MILFRLIETLIGRFTSKQRNVKTYTYKKIRQEAYERRFWRKQLKAAYCLNLITAIGATGTMLGLFFVGYGLIISRAQLDEAREEQRPWLKADVTFARPLEFGGMNYSNLEFKITIQNIGKSPAFNVEAVMLRYFPQVDKKLASQVVSDSCENDSLYNNKRRLRSDDIIYPQQTILPGETVDAPEDSMENTISWTDKEIPEKAIHHMQIGNFYFEAINVVAIACVRYRSGGSDKTHVSEKFIMLGWSPHAPGAPGSNVINLPLHQSVPQSDLLTYTYSEPGPGPKTD